MTHLGKDCDVILIHPDVYHGNPFGFVLTPDGSGKGSSFSIQREITTSGDISVFIFFTVILSDDLKNPDGSMHSDNRSLMYQILMDFLSKSSGLSVGTVMGTWLGIGPLGHAATEIHLVEGSYISVKLGNVSTYHPPISSDLFFNSQWNATPPGASALTWGSSIWR